MNDFSPAERVVIAWALDFFAEGSTLDERMQVLRGMTDDMSSAPIRALAGRVREAI